MLNDKNIQARTATYESQIPLANFETFRSYFKVNVSCDGANYKPCWEDSGEKVNNREPAAESPQAGFIDNMGRAWMYFPAGYGADGIYVDVNAFKQPNRYGKDRFVFYPRDVNNSLGAGLPVKLTPRNDETIYSPWMCHYPPCYFRSWLISP